MKKKSKRIKNRQWKPLDSAAKIFPVASTRSDTKVFRFVCELKEDVVQKTLQEALNRTLEVFPIFRSVMKKGLFWYYLETGVQEAIVREEYRQPCGPMYDPNVKNYLFEVTFYRRRINFEVYHSLTDGTGALQFLRYLVALYLMLRYDGIPESVLAELGYEASADEKNDDSFSRYYDAKKLKAGKKKHKIHNVYKFHGHRLSEYRIRIIQGELSAKSLIGKAHEYGATVTVFLTALLIASVGDVMAPRDYRKPVVVKIPVNLRNYFSSSSARNFFGIINAKYDFGRMPGTFEDIVECVRECFKQELTKDQLMVRLHTIGSLEHNFFARITPLFIKNFFMKIGYIISDKKFTCTISNVANVKMPEILNQYIYKFDVFLSTNKQQVCVCSFDDRMTISFTTPFVSTALQKAYFKRLTDMGIDVILTTSQDMEEPW